MNENQIMKSVQDISPISVRVLTPADAEAYRAVRLCALHEQPPAFGSLPEIEPNLSETAARLAESDDRCFFGAFQGEQLIGMIRLSRYSALNEKHRAYLAGLYVLLPFRGHGCGTALVREALSRAAIAPGIRRVNLTVVTQQEVAIRLYQSFGFRIYGTEQETFSRDGQFYDEHLMTLELNSDKATHSYMSQGLQTTAIHAGEKPDTATRASSPSIVMSSSFVTDADTSFSAENLQDQTTFFYTREGNPTVQQLEQKLAALEDAEACVAFSSGMAAISALMFHMLKPGDHVVMSDVAYVGAAELMRGLIPRLGIQVTRVNTTDLKAVQAAILPQTRLVHVETPCNPIVRLADIRAIAEIAHAAGAKLSVDSTFATPVATQPIKLGADFVVHSLSKYLCGHGDAIGGAVLGASDKMSGIRHLLIHIGGALSPFNAWLIMRGITTLPIRMKAHEGNALKVARFLESHPQVKQVIYPGLPSHPQHELAKQQMSNFSGMIAFQTQNPVALAQAFAEHLQVIHYAVSLGHQRSLIYYISTKEMLETSFTLTETQVADYRNFAGDGVFRLSVGLEDVEDICKDLDLSMTRA